MKYYTMTRNESDPVEIGIGEAAWYLMGAYQEEFVREIIDGQKMFKLFTPFRDVWTVKEGLMLFQYGVYEE